MLKVGVINALEAYSKIRNSKTPFHAYFEKREGGTRCMLAERRASRGGTYKAEAKLCVVVWDLLNKEYRNIPLDGLRVIRFGNRSFTVKGFSIR